MGKLVAIVNTITWDIDSRAYLWQIIWSGWIEKVRTVHCGSHHSLSVNLHYISGEKELSSSMPAVIALCLARVVMWPALSSFLNYWTLNREHSERENKSKNREQNNTRNLSLWNCVVRVYYHSSRRKNQEKKLRRNERKHALVRNTLFFIFL